MFILISLTFILVVIYCARQMRKPSNFPPGPLWYPFVGNVPLLKKLSKSHGGQHHALQALAKKYNTNILGLKLGNEYVVTVLSYPLIREVLIEEEFEGRPDNFFFKLRCMGEKRGITGNDGEMWTIQRTFVNRHLRNLGFGKNTMEKMIQDEVSEILSVLKKDGAEISVNKLLAPSVLNVLWTLITGERIPRENIRLDELLNLFALRSKAFDMTGGTLSLYPWLRYIVPEWSGYNLIKKINASMRDTFINSIRDHEEKWQPGKNEDLIYRYISEAKMNSKNGNHFTEDQLVMNCADLFIAGAQTTSRSLEFAFLMMVTYPEIQKKVHAQIEERLEKTTSIEYQDRHKVPYVEAVLLETIRFRNVTPIIGPRRVLKDTTLEGYAIPKNTTILIHTYSVHNSPEHWTDPEIFMPERFLDDEGLLVPNEKLIPYGLGRRRCLGEILAKSCLFVFFTEIMRKCAVSLADKSEVPSGKCSSGITLSPEQFTAKFVERA